MADFEETLNNIISDPDAMNKIMGLAQSLSGGQQKENQEKEPEPEEHPEENLLKQGMEFLKGSQNSREADLLNALKPFLKEEKRGKLDRALKLARTTALIRSAVSAMGKGGKDV